jgi:Tol biopolymer transport system component
MLLTVGVGVNSANESDSVAVVDLATGEHRVLVQGIFGRYAASGHLVYVRYDGTLLAAPFDQDKLVLTGPAVALLGGIAVRAGPDLALSQTGRLVYSSSEAREEGLDEMVWVARDGTAQEVDPGWTNDFSTLALSPDGSQLAVMIREAGEQQIWIKQLDQGPLQKLTFQESITTNPTWTTDGRSVTFTSGGDVYVKPADGSAGAELLLPFDRGVQRPGWSPDGEWLVFHSGGAEVDTGAEDIFAIRLGVDSVPMALVAEEGVAEGLPRLSPDGRWLAYVSNETGQAEVYVRPFPSVNAKWLVSTNGGTEPRWAHSGRELFYISGSNEMVVADVLAGSTFSLGERRVLFPLGALRTNRWDVAPDDQRFIFERLGSAGGESGDLIVVENFFEELKAKVGNR